MISILAHIFTYRSFFFVRKNFFIHSFAVAFAKLVHHRFNVEYFFVFFSFHHFNHFVLLVLSTSLVKMKNFLLVFQVFVDLFSPHPLDLCSLFFFFYFFFLDKPMIINEGIYLYLNQFFLLSIFLKVQKFKFGKKTEKINSQFKFVNHFKNTRFSYEQRSNHRTKSVWKWWKFHLPAFNFFSHVISNFLLIIFNRPTYYYIE